jgi:hydrogenase maturation protein HypF
MWQNQLLLNLVRAGLEDSGFIVYIHKQVPTNDGGLSLGQAVIANHLPAEQSELAGERYRSGS